MEVNRRKTVALLTYGLFAGTVRVARGASSQEIHSSPNDSSDPLQLELDRIRSQIQHLLANPAPELYHRHLLSIQVLCEEAVLAAQVAGASYNNKDELLGYLKEIASRISQSDVQSPAANFDEGRRDLVITRISRSDGTIQPYSVRLPSRWDRHKSYPLWVQLHGRWSDLSLALVSNKLAPLEANDKPEEESIVLTPWVRGNSDYRLTHGSEPDIWEAIDDLSTFANLNRNRWYLSGHSWGGDDTWAIVLRTPDLWAAAGIMAGDPIGIPDQLGLVPNARNVPFYIWRGSVDPVPNRAKNFDYFRNALLAVGNPPKAVIAEGVPHMYRPQDLADLRVWLYRHERKRPSSFSFVIDTPEHRGIWGISIPIRYEGAYFDVEPKTGFHCEIEGSTVRIETTNANRLDIDLNPLGLNNSESVSIFVNARQMFRGAPPNKPLTFSW